MGIGGGGAPEGGPVLHGSPLYRKKKKEIVTSFFTEFLDAVFEIKVLFCAPLGCTHIETVRPGVFLCTPLVSCNGN